jgi:hypothetical protein
MIDTYLSHHKDVITTIHRLETKLKGVSTETSTTIEITGVQGELLTDVGRIALQSGLANQNRPLLIYSDESSVVIWTSDDVDTNSVLLNFQQKNLNPVLTSTKSVRLVGLPKESHEDVLETIVPKKKKGRSS